LTAFDFSNKTHKWAELSSILRSNYKKKDIFCVPSYQIWPLLSLFVLKLSLSLYTYTTQSYIFVWRFCSICVNLLYNCIYTLLSFWPLMARSSIQIDRWWLIFALTASLLFIQTDPSTFIPLLHLHKHIIKKLTTSLAFLIHLQDLLLHSSLLK